MLRNKSPLLTNFRFRIIIMFDNKQQPSVVILFKSFQLISRCNGWDGCQALLCPNQAPSSPDHPLFFSMLLSIRAAECTKIPGRSFQHKAFPRKSWAVKHHMVGVHYDESPTLRPSSLLIVSKALRVRYYRPTQHFCRAETYFSMATVLPFPNF